jgi:hypothetical protein
MRKSLHNPNHLDVKRRAVLGAFVFNPAWTQFKKKGFRARDVWATSPNSFKKLWPRAKTAAPVASICKSLVNNGWLYVPGYVKAMTPSLYNHASTEYESPLFSPTERGLLYVLTSDQFDLSSLVVVKNKRSSGYDFNYDATDSDVKMLFNKFIGIYADEPITGLYEEED